MAFPKQIHLGIMKVALIFNPFSYKAHEENLRVVQKYFGLFPPLSLAWVASIIRESGHDATIIDARTLRLTPEDVARRLLNYTPQVIGFMILLTLRIYPPVEKKIPYFPLINQTLYLFLVMLMAIYSTR